MPTNNTPESAVSSLDAESGKANDGGPLPRRAKRPDAKTTNQIKPGTTKAEALLKKLTGPKGASIQALMEATGWQAHSVRGFLSGTVKKRLGRTLISEVGKDGVRRYRITALTVSG